MSEFSDSYHLKGGDAGDGVNLLRRANLRGFVFPEQGGWVTILPKGQPFTPNAALILQNSGLLFHYVNAEDHGWSFELYEGTRLVASYECDWNDDLNIVKPLNLGAFEERMGPTLSKLGKEKLRAVFDPVDLDEVLRTNPAEAVARALGLVHFSWTSFEYILADRSRGEESAAKALFVE